jgi:uncharacterized protein YvpB
MAIASLPRPRGGIELRPAQNQWRLFKVLALALLAVLILTIPSGLVLGEVLTQNAHQTALHLQADLTQAVTDGVDPEAVRPLTGRLTAIAPPGSWEDPVRAEQQLHQLAQLHSDLDALYARTLAATRDAYLRTYRQWEDLASQAQTAGLSLEGLSDPVRRLHAIADETTTPAGFRGTAGVLSTYMTSLADRLAAFTAARTEANSVLAQARATLLSAAQFRELKLSPFQGQLDTAAKDMAAVQMADGFAAIKDRIRQTEAAIKGLLSARQAAYAELAAARAALSNARAAGVDVSSHATSIDALAGQLSVAGDDQTFTSITTQLSAQRQALNSLLIVTVPAPIYRQAMPLDCETSALRIALAYYGHYYTDAQLFAAEPVDLRPPVMGPNHTILQWGNPYTHFVGNVNGAAATPTGYGVYYPVIVTLARSHGLPNTVGGEGYSAATIYAELRAHHPVEVWVEYNWTGYQTGIWTAWDGTRVRYSYGEHAVTLTGVSPTEVRVNDPGHGTQYWINKSTFEIFWRDFNNMAVIFK